MELFFIALLVLLMIAALGSGFPVAFALPGSAIVAVGLAALSGWLFVGNPDAFFAQGSATQWLTAGVTNFRSVYWEAERDTLIAIPLFVFMGIMLQRSRIAEDLLVTMAQLFGPVRGGLGMSVVFVGALLAATTGIVGATVVAMGLISLPAMLRNNYSHPLATGTIAASGTLGQIIPPSIVLIILADQLGSAADQASAARKALYKETTGQLTLPSEFDVISTSAGEMFLGAFVPGLCLVAIYMVFILVVAFIRPQIAPAVPYEGKFDLQFAARVVVALVPPLALIFIVLGSIIMGIATVNQAGAIGAAGALIMAGYRLYEGRRGTYWPVILAFISVVIIIAVVRINPINIKKIATGTDVVFLMIALFAVAGLLAALVWSGWRALRVDQTLQGVMVETAKTTSLVFIILLGAAMLTAAFRGFGGEELVRHFLTSLPGGFWSQFAIVMAVIFLLGFFLDFIEIAVVVVPIVAPILLTDPGANVTAVWLGVMVGVNIQTSFLTPPFGFALFYLRGVAPAIVSTLSIYKGVIPFIIMQLLVLAFVAVTPSLVNYLPQRVSLTAATAPPPINPKLQACIEERTARVFNTRGSEIRAAIARAKQLDLSGLPEDLRKDVSESFVKAEATIGLLDKAIEIDRANERAAVTYAPLHHRVRDIQADMRRHDVEVAELRQLAGLTADDETGRRRKQNLEARIAKLQDERKALESSIPANWQAENTKFRRLLLDERRSRLMYRRNADSAYEPIDKAIEIIGAADTLAALKPDLEGLRGMIDSQNPETAAEIAGRVLNKVGDVPGADRVRSEVAKARRALRARDPDKAEAQKSLDAALAAFAADLAWRQRAAQNVLPSLRAYERAIHDTIGLRRQERMPSHVAVDIASCQAHHRDLSLQF